MSAKRKLLCQRNCGHTAKEHKAFDAGLWAGEHGQPESACVLTGGLREAWLTGHSVGVLNFESKERTCVHCGCTDSRACPGGCGWIEIHTCTPTGICSNCGPKNGMKIGNITLAKLNAGKIWLQHVGGEGIETPEPKLAKALREFFNKHF